MIGEPSSNTRPGAGKPGPVRICALALSLLLLLSAAALAASSASTPPQEEPPGKARDAAPPDSAKNARIRVKIPARPSPKRERLPADGQRWKPTDRRADTNSVQPPPIFTPFPLRTPPAGVVYDTGVWKPARGGDDRFAKRRTERDLTPEDAVEELLSLLEKHPEFRRTILREIFAGEGMKTVKPLEIEEYLRLAVKAMRFKSSYEYELAKRGGGGYTGPYDPIYGFDRDKTVGLQVNIFELLKFLKGLIGGE